MNDFGPLFNQRYPETPGYAKGSPTSRAAAVAVLPKVGGLRLAILRLLADHALGIDDVAAKLDRHILVVRPRISELRELGLVHVVRRVTTSSLGNPQSCVSITDAGQRYLDDVADSGHDANGATASAGSPNENGRSVS